MNSKDIVIEKLQSLGITFAMLDHQPIMTMGEGKAIANALGLVACKNLFLVNKQGEHFLLLLSGEKRLNAKSIARQIGSSHLSFASDDDLQELLSTTQGAISTLGLMFDDGKRVKLIIDKDVANQEFIGCHPCVNTCSLKLRTKDVLDKFLTAVGHEEYTTIEIPQE